VVVVSAHPTTWFGEGDRVERRNFRAIVATLIVTTKGVGHIFAFSVTSSILPAGDRPPVTRDTPLHYDFKELLMLFFLNIFHFVIGFKV
jgi:hypothetical protein